MKLAVILSGQLRTWKICRELLKKQLLDHYDCDIFMAIDSKNNIQCENKNSTTETVPSEITEAINFYKPKGIVYDDITDYSLLSTFPRHLKHYIKMDNTNPINVTCDNNKFIFNRLCNPLIEYRDICVPIENNLQLQLIFRQYYHFNKAFEMMYNYSKNNNIEYDIIVRVRFDQYLFDKKNNYYDKLYSILEKNSNSDIMYNTNNINIIANFENELKISFGTNIKDNEVYVFGAGLYNKSYIYVNDQFFYFNYKTAKIFDKFLEKIIEEYKKSADNYWLTSAHIEHNFAKILFKNKVNIIRSNIKGIFIREN